MRVPQIFDTFQGYNPAFSTARADMFDYIEVFCNRVRRHNHLGQLSSYDFEQAALSRICPLRQEPSLIEKVM